MIPTVSLATLVISMSGCLVTDKIDFADAPEQPPRIVDVPGTNLPIGSIFWVDKSVVGSEWQMEVRIIEENLTEGLKAHHRLVSNGQQVDGYVSNDVDQEGQRTRTYTFTVGTAPIIEGQCYRLDLAVSGHFAGQKDAAFLAVDDGFEDQTSLAQWWVLEGSSDQSTAPDDMALLASCAAPQVTKPDAGTEP